MGLLAVALVGAAPAPPTDGPARAEGARLAAACKGRNGWSDAAPPARIFGNSYYVGTCGISVVLIASSRVHILIDSGPADAAPAVLANIRKLGFDPRDVKLIVGSHEHHDHIGGFAALKAATGAVVAARESARASMESGKPDPADPQTGTIPNMVPVKVDRLVADGETLTVGTNAIKAIATPGHTAGGTSWSWRTCNGPTCANIAYVDSLTAVARDGYHFSDHPERVAPFRETFKRVPAMKCDILITPHPSFSDLFARLVGREPLAARDACARLARAMRDRLDARLAAERKQP